MSEQSTRKTTIIGGDKKPRNKASSHGVKPVDVMAVNSAESRELYQSRVPIYPKLAHGKFRKIKWALLFLTLGVYYLLPLLRWDHGGNAPDQAVLADFAGQRFYFFFIEIWPTEFYYITGLLILGAFALFLATALFGRVWCGYTCPQTIWTDLFIAVERWIEGDRNARIKLARQPMRGQRLFKAILKHAVWLLISLMTGGAFVLYFHDAPTVLRGFFIGQAPVSAYMFAGILTFTTYALAGLMREQVCTFLCPWPRIQAALTDEDTFEVTYRKYRGEPRGAHKKNDSWEGRGDCISCRMCVAVCPMGIDIRDGDQLECINCALCIDACDSVMKKVGRPTGLIAYDTENNRKRHECGEQPKARLLRARTIAYGVLITGIGLLMVAGLASRSTMDLNILRDRSPTFVRLSDGSVRNGYLIKIINKGKQIRQFDISLDGLDNYTVKVVGMRDIGQDVVVSAKPDEARNVKMYVTIPKAEIATANGSIPINFIVSERTSGAADPQSMQNKSVFITGKK
ncbi:Type cbb3 cytochrome oxidase biogenesis protein CcoG, involved in Cu oxidation [hydrothermal vent metagenome]|uniref:Type cbb3 cytochrome oxidase biogenesis protein CcoG, involved in Cu oxidation n=1 Tax=hydrothermal vent metagenome TaxID=652676 RepID=A0A3B0RLN5_9ZZZZ